jgi:raffinose/stachyose/melibiose transport system permease protein
VRRHLDRSDPDDEKERIMMRSRTSSLLSYGVLTVLAAVALAPLLFTLGASLKSAAEYAVNPGMIPQSVTLANYSWAIVDGEVFHYLINSLLLVPVALVLYLAVCVSAGFAFGKLKFRFRLTVFLVVLFLMIFPQMLLVIQMFKMMAAMKLTNTFLGLILAWVAYFAPFGTYIMTTYFSTVPEEIIESARIDGAGSLRILTSIMAPIGAPMIGNIAIIGFLSMWGELPFSLLLLQDNTLRTMTLAVAMLQGQYGLSIPALSTILIITAALPILVFLFFQRYVTQGATAGAVKG